MTTVTLHPGAVTTSGSAAGSLVGSGAVWADGSDATYLDTSATAGAGTTFAGSAPLDVLSLPAGATVNSVTVTMRASGETDSASNPYVNVEVFGSGVDIGVSWPVGSLPTTGVPTDVSRTLSSEYAGWGVTLSALVAALQAGASIIAYSLSPPVSGTMHEHVYELAVVVDYDGGSIDLPCDTWVDLDLSAAVILEDGSGNATGIYGDGVIYGNEVAGTALYPDLSFTGVDLDPAKPYLVESTYDPGSGHDFGGRGRIISAFRPGLAQADLDAGGAFGNLYSGFLGSVADTLQIKVGPGIEDWDDATYGVAQGYTTLAFQSDRIGALSAVRIRKLCTFVQPWLRQTNRQVGRLTNRSERQNSNRLTGIL